MTAEYAPAGIAIAVFDLNGQRVATPTELTRIIDPDEVVAAKDGQTVSQRVAALAREIAHAPAIGIRFGKFTDGRSYSVAARLRESGFTGELHALGEINQEVVFLLKRVGFTHFHIPDPGHLELPDIILTPFGGHYQAGSDGSRAPWQTLLAA